MRQVDTGYDQSGQFISTQMLLQPCLVQIKPKIILSDCKCFRCWKCICAHQANANMISINTEKKLFQW